jgi:ribosome-associated protein
MEAPSAPISARTMSRPDERERRRRPTAGDAVAAASTASAPQDRPPSKTRRKAEARALQDIGADLVALPPGRLSQLAAEVALPERLVEAIREARAITAWGGRKRQLQFVGKLMREVDPEPIRRQLERWAHRRDAESARLHAFEQWRDRLIADPAAIDLLAAEHPGLDRRRAFARVPRTLPRTARARRHAARRRAMNPLPPVSEPSGHAPVSGQDRDHA